MSTHATQIRCRGCDFKGVILHREITLRYHLPSGNIVSGYRTCGWCYSCETNRDIERPFDVGEIIDKIQQLQQQKPRGLFTYIFGSGSKQRESNPEATKNLQDELYLARKRKSPPHCLNCGSDKTLPLEFGSNGLSLSFIHYCGERLQRCSHGQLTSWPTMRAWLNFSRSMGRFFACHIHAPLVTACLSCVRAGDRALVARFIVF